MAVVALKRYPVGTLALAYDRPHTFAPLGMVWFASPRGPGRRPTTKRAVCDLMPDLSSLEGVDLPGSG